MSVSVQRLTLSNLPSFNHFLLSEIRDRTSQIFQKISESLFSAEQQPLLNRPTVDLGALGRDPSQFIEGGFLGLWWVAGVHFLKSSGEALYTVIMAEDSTNVKFEKICCAVKAVFTDALSLVSSTFYIFRWADAAEVIALGKYLPLVTRLCYGTSLAVHGAEIAFDGRQLAIEMVGFSAEGNPNLAKQRFQRACYLSIKLISNISMLAWAALGIVSLAGVAIHAAIMPQLLMAGCVIGVAAIWYKMQIER